MTEDAAMHPIESTSSGDGAPAGLGDPGDAGDAGDRRRRFEDELARIRLGTGVVARERRGLIVGVATAVAGVATAVVAFAISLTLADSRDVISMVVLAVLGLCATVAGSALALRYALARVLRLVLLRLLYEQHASPDP